MKILRNYILKELIYPFFLSLIVFTFVLVCGNILRLAEMMVTKGISAVYILKLFLYLLPSLLDITIPMAVLSAVLIAVGRLASDNEIIMLRASGLNLFQIIIPLLTVGIIASLLLVILNDRILPYSIYETRRLVKEIGIRNPTAYMEEGVFIKAFRNYVVYIHKIDKNKIQGVRIYEPQADRPTRTIIANRGRFFPSAAGNKIKLELYDGTSDEPDPNDPNTFYKLNFKTYRISLDLTDELTKKAMDKKPKDMSIKELMQEINNMKAKDIDHMMLVAEIYKKISRSFSAVIFVLVGVPIALMVRRGEKTISFGISIAVVVVYYLLLLGGEALVIRGFVHPAIGMNMANALMLLLGIFLTFKITRY
ncbi:MAG: LptF/LptG family permease [Candidatus Omnitrophota bacterium]